MEDRVFSRETVVELWRIIRPADETDAFYLLNTMITLAETNRDKWFHYGFLVPKRKPGMYRRITPARKPLGITQYYLAEWIQRRFDLGHDFGFEGVLPAVQMHQGAMAAFKIDLHSAYDYVTEQKLRWHLKTALNADVLDFVIALITYDGSTPQGCASTPFAYNILAARLDKILRTATTNLPVWAITRYADDILISLTTLKGVNTQKVTTQICSLVAGAGFKVGKSEWFDKEPFTYLGTRIYANQLLLTESKYSEILEAVEIALADVTPIAHKKRITGLLVWSAYISNTYLPREVLKAFINYYDKVGGHPQTLLELMNGRFF